MSNSKFLAPFICDSLYYLNRDHLERFSIVCRLLKNFIDRYFGSKPYRIFDELRISGGSYMLRHNKVQWHPNREDYSVQQFLAGQCYDTYAYYPFVEMRPYLSPTIRIKLSTIYVADDFTNNPKFIAEMESIAYLWRDHEIDIWNARYDRLIAKDFQSILNSPTILQCRRLFMFNPYFSFKDYGILYTANDIEILYDEVEIDLSWQPYWQQFLEKPGVKPVVVFRFLPHENVDNLIDRLSKTFSSSILPNAFKIVFVQVSEPLTVFRETNKTSGDILELKKGLPTEYQEEYFKDNYTLERSSI